MRVRSRGARTILAALCVLLPERLRRLVHTRLLGHSVHPTARIGRSLIDVDLLVLANDASIGPLNVIRGCTEVRLGPGARIGSLVWVNSVREEKGHFVGQDRRPALVMGTAAIITSLHFIDACDLVELADYSAVGGVGTIIQTHAYDTENVRQASAPIRIGDHSMLGTRCTVLPGAVVPDQSIVAAGAVVARALEGHHLFAGVPARPVRDLDPEGPFFARSNPRYR